LLLLLLLLMFLIAVKISAEDFPCELESASICCILSGGV